LRSQALEVRTAQQAATQQAARADAAEAECESASAETAELRFQLRFAELQRAFAVGRRGAPSPRTPSRTLRRVASPAPTP
jgi:hypothetical protein